MKTFYKPSDAIKWTKERLRNYGYVVKTEKWQAIVTGKQIGRAHV